MIDDRRAHTDARQSVAGEREVVIRHQNPVAGLAGSGIRSDGMCVGVRKSLVRIVKSCGDGSNPETR